MKYFSYLGRGIGYLENSAASFWQIAAVFFGIIILRLGVEHWLGDFLPKSATLIFYEFSHNFLFFLLSFLIFLLFLSGYLKLEYRKVATILGWGFLVILLPPVVDFLISRGQGFWSFYAFDSLFGIWRRLWLFFGDSPQIGITYGVRVEVILAMIFLAVYAFVKTKKALKSAIVFAFSYLILFILGTFPSWITYLYLFPKKDVLEIDKLDVAKLFLTPANVFLFKTENVASVLNFKMSLIYSLLITLLLLIFFFYKFKEKLAWFLKSIRPSRIVYHGGLLFVGLALGVYYYGMFDVNLFNLLVIANVVAAVGFAWIASIFVNDCYDLEADKITNQNRFSVRGIFNKSEYQTLGILFFIASIFFAALAGFKIAAFMLIYQVIAWFYSAYPLRLKRFPLIAGLVSALASIFVFLAGFSLISGDKGISEIPGGILWLLIIGCAVSLPIKDLKDIPGDRKIGVWTIPAIFGESKGRLIIASGIFVSHLLSVVFLNEPKLFWPAFVFGAISFWIVNSKKIKPAMLPVWVFGEVFIYGLVLIKIVFF